MGLMEHTLSSPNGMASLNTLAEGLAQGLRPAHEVWEEHGVTTKDEARALLAVPAFKAMLNDYRAAWNSSQKIPERIRVRAAMSIEHSLLNLHRAANNSDNPLASRVQALTFLSRMAGMEQQSQVGGGPAGGGISISIDLSGDGRDAQVVKIDATQKPVVDATPVYDGIEAHDDGPSTYDLDIAE